MSGREDGGPAFPRENSNPLSYDVQPGMTLRDYFAGQALQGIEAGCTNESWPESNWNKEAARHAYEIADALLAARVKP